MKNSGVQPSKGKTIARIVRGFLFGFFKCGKERAGQKKAPDFSGVSNRYEDWVFSLSEKDYVMVCKYQWIAHLIYILGWWTPILGGFILGIVVSCNVAN